MKKLIVSLACVLVLAGVVRLLAADAPAAAPAVPPAAVAPPGELKFTTHNTVYNAEGSFASWRVVKSDIPGGDFTKGVVEIEVDLASVTEKSEKLSAHLRTPDFFDAAKYQKATITISGAKPAGEKKYNATAAIDLHGMKGTTPVAFEVVSEKPLTIKGTAKLDRTAFKIGEPYDAANKYAPLNEVEITLNAKLE
jgi:polyisoprenoid-binding protein YceI